MKSLDYKRILTNSRQLLNYLGLNCHQYLIMGHSLLVFLIANEYLGSYWLKFNRNEAFCISLNNGEEFSHVYNQQQNWIPATQCASTSFFSTLCGKRQHRLTSGVSSSSACCSSTLTSVSISCFIRCMELLSGDASSNW